MVKFSQGIEKVVVQYSPSDFRGRPGARRGSKPVSKKRQTKEIVGEDLGH